jgi:hypothetical protein
MDENPRLSDTQSAQRDPILQTLENYRDLFSKMKIHRARMLPIQMEEPNHPPRRDQIVNQCQERHAGWGMGRHPIFEDVSTPRFRMPVLLLLRWAIVFTLMIVSFGCVIMRPIMISSFPFAAESGRDPPSLGSWMIVDALFGYRLEQGERERCRRTEYGWTRRFSETILSRTGLPFRESHTGA